MTDPGTQDNTQQANTNSDNASPASEGLQETFISHLVELRDRIIKAALAIIIIFMGLVYWAPEIFHLFAQPLLTALPSGGKMIVTDITGSFFVPMKVTMLVAFVIALPVVMYQLWAFIAPGLYTHERRLIVPLVVSSYSLFIIGMSFAYFLVFPSVFKFMAHYNAPLGAEMVVVVLVRMGVVPLAKLREIRPYVIVGAFVIAAVVTPPDILSQLLLAVPMSLLYELGLFIARFYEKKPTAVSDDEVVGGAPTNS
jgi:sec-independent protein translocase protein TatC